MGLHSKTLPLKGAGNKGEVVVLRGLRLLLDQETRELKRKRSPWFALLRVSSPQQNNVSQLPRRTRTLRLEG